MYVFVYILTYHFCFLHTVGGSTANVAAGTIRAAWEKYCVSPKHIDSRRISVLPDAEAAKDPADLDFATIPFTSP